MGRRRRHEEHENHERWLVSYADMVTLLMVFFIVLYASSQINVSKYRAIHEAAADSLGAGPRETKQVVAAANNGGDAPDGPPVVKEPGKDVVANEDAALLAKLKREVAKAGLKDSVKVYRDARGIVVYFTDRVLFEPGNATVRPAGARVIQRLSPILADQGHPIVVEGHTDNRPISTAAFPTNWELSTSRATRVLRSLLSGGVPAGQVAASGYADTHPKRSNASAAGRSANRRVEVVVVTSSAVGDPNTAALASSRTDAPAHGEREATTAAATASEHAGEESAEDDEDSSGHSSGH